MKIKALISLLLIASAASAQQIRPITQVNDINLVGDEYHTKPVQWFAGDSLKFDVLARDVRTPVDFSGAAFPVLFVAAETNVAQVYIIATGTVVSATNGHVSVSVTSSNALLDPAIAYAAWMTVFRVANSQTQEVATVAYSQATVRESPLGEDYTYLSPTSAPFVFNVGAIQVNPTNWSQFSAQRRVDLAGYGLTNAGQIYGDARGLTNFPAQIATNHQWDADVAAAQEAASNLLYGAAYIPGVREPTELRYQLGEIWDAGEYYVKSIEDDATYIRTWGHDSGNAGAIDIRSRLTGVNDIGHQLFIGKTRNTNAFTFTISDDEQAGDFVVRWDVGGNDPRPGRVMIGTEYKFSQTTADFGAVVLKGNGSQITGFDLSTGVNPPAAWTAQPSLLALSNAQAATELKAGYASNRANFAYTLADQANTLASMADTDTAARASIVLVGAVASQALATASAPTDAVARASALAQGVVASNALALASATDTDTTARAWASAGSNLALSASRASTDLTARAWAQAGSNLASSAFTLASMSDTDTVARAWVVASSNLALLAHGYAGSNAVLISAETAARIAADAASSSTVSTLSTRYAVISNDLDVLSLSLESVSSKVDEAYGWGNHANAGYAVMQPSTSLVYGGVGEDVPAGHHSIALGQQISVGNNSIVVGHSTGAGNYSAAFGYGQPTPAGSGDYSLSFGRECEAGNKAFAGGYLSEAADLSFAFGFNAFATEEQSVVFNMDADNYDAQVAHSFNVHASGGFNFDGGPANFSGGGLYITEEYGNRYVSLTVAEGLKVGLNSFEAKPSGDISHDPTNTAVLGILSATSIKNTNGTSVLYAGEAPTTAAFLSLSGRVTSAESGIASLTGTVANQSASLLATSNNLASLISSESSARIGADAALTSSVSAMSALLTATSNTLAAGISGEIAARVWADAALTSLVSSLTATLTGTSNTLAGLYAAEAAARIAADASLTSGVASAVASVGTASNTLNAAITNEVAARIAGDSAITATVAGVSAALVATSNSLAGAISSEASGRIDADAALSNLVSAAEAATVALGYIVSNSVDAARLGGSLPAAYFLLTDFQSEMTNRVRMVSGVESNSAPGGYAWVQLVSKGGGTNELWVYGDHALGTNTPGWAIFDGRTP